MPFAIIDTNVYINYWEGVLDEQSLVRVGSTFVIRQSSVVLSELRRGARTPESRQLVEQLRRLAKIQWSPTSTDWWTAAIVIQKIGDAEKWDRRKRQEFQNDVLIALSAHRHGATVVTTNRTDFELIATQVKVKILPVSASP